MSKSYLFKAISRDYDTMKVAQEQLLERHLRTTETTFINRSTVKQKMSTMKPLESSQQILVKPGRELKKIRRWEALEDELDELQKIFFSFVKRWTEGVRDTSDVNELITYEVYSDEEEF